MTEQNAGQSAEETLRVWALGDQELDQKYLKSLVAYVLGQLAGQRVVIRKERHRATNAEYMRDAYLQMLGPKALQVAKIWHDKGVVRVHHDWTSMALRELDGEQRAQHLLDFEAAAENAVPLTDEELKRF